MKKLLLFVALTAGVQTSAQAIDLMAGRFRNITLTGNVNLGNVGASSTKICLNTACTMYLWRSDANTVQIVNGGAVQLQTSAATGIVSNPTTNPGFSSHAASGSNAFAADTNGARIDFGAGATDYASSDGTSVSFAGPANVPAGQRLGYEGNSQGFVSDGTNVASGRPIIATNFFNSSTTGTAASGTGVTATYTSAIRQFVHKVTVINTALAAAGTSDVTLHTTPVNTRIIRVTADVTQVFTGGALSAMTVMCGNSAGGNQYLLANSVFTAQNTWGDAAAEIGAGLLSATVADMGTSAAGVPGAITVQCRFTCTGASCNAATQGSVTFYVEGVTY